MLRSIVAGGKAAGIIRSESQQNHHFSKPVFLFNRPRIIFFAQGCADNLHDGRLLIIAIAVFKRGHHLVGQRNAVFPRQPNNFRKLLIAEFFFISVRIVFLRQRQNLLLHELLRGQIRRRNGRRCQKKQQRRKNHSIKAFSLRRFHLSRRADHPLCEPRIVFQAGKRRINRVLNLLAPCLSLHPRSPPSNETLSFSRAFLSRVATVDCGIRKISAISRVVIC